MKLCMLAYNIIPTTKNTSHIYFLLSLNEMLNFKTINMSIFSELQSKNSNLKLCCTYLLLFTQIENLLANRLFVCSGHVCLKPILRLVWQTRTRPKITSVFRGRAEARHHDVKVTLKGGGGESPGSRYGSLALCSLRGGRYSPHSASII